MKQIDYKKLYEAYKEMVKEDYPDLTRKEVNAKALVFIIVSITGLCSVIFILVFEDLIEQEFVSFHLAVLFHYAHLFSYQIIIHFLNLLEILN